MRLDVIAGEDRYFKRLTQRNTHPHTLTVLATMSL